MANKFNFKVTLPFMLFKDIAGVDIKAVFDIKYVLFCAIVSTICFWVVQWGRVVKSFWVRGTKRDPRGICTVVFPAEVRRLCVFAFIQNIYILCNGTADDRQCSAAHNIFRSC